MDGDNYYSSCKEEKEKYYRACVGTMYSHAGGKEMLLKVGGSKPILDYKADKPNLTVIIRADKWKNGIGSLRIEYEYDDYSVFFFDRSGTKIERLDLLGIDCENLQEAIERTVLVGKRRYFLSRAGQRIVERHWNEAKARYNKAFTCYNPYR